MLDDEKLVKVTLIMPKDKHRKLKAVAALRDQGLSSYIMECVEKITFAKSTDLDSQHTDVLAEIEELAKK